MEREGRAEGKGIIGKGLPPCRASHRGKADSWGSWFLSRTTKQALLPPAIESVEWLWKTGPSREWGRNTFCLWLWRKDHPQTRIPIRPAMLLCTSVVSVLHSTGKWHWPRSLFLGSNPKFLLASYQTSTSSSFIWKLERIPAVGFQWKC